MRKRKIPPYPKRGELDVFILSVSKDELMELPHDQRSFYLYLGQLLNEINILQTLLLRCIKQKSKVVAVQETALGMTLSLARSMCGRIVEAHKAINRGHNRDLLGNLWKALPDGSSLKSISIDAEAARDRLNKELGSGTSIISRVRNKQAYHLDQEILEKAFHNIPEALDLADYHTGMRGTTFFGIADTAAAVATADLSKSHDVAGGIDAMVKAVTAATRDLQDFAYGYLLAFYLVNFGPQRLAVAQSVRLSGLLDVDKAALNFFMTSNRKRRPH